MDVNFQFLPPEIFDIMIYSDTIDVNSNPGNWRPISLANIFSKIFLPGKSTHEAIFRTVKDIYSSLNQRKLMGIMSLDIAKAFNCISHDILFLKMSEAGFSNNVINWFCSYLNRKQNVTIGSITSETVPVVNGIAQGTVLGPILFIFYINNIFNCTTHVKMSLFADDCIMYLSGNNWQSIQTRMQEDFNAIIEWTLRNNLRLNASKTNAMIVGTNSRISNLINPLKMKYMSENIRYVKQCNYLGIVLDNTMSLVPLVKNVKKKIVNKMFMLKFFLTFDASISIYKQMILPIIDYAGFMIIGCRIVDKGDLQKIQNDILRICDKSRIVDKVSIDKLHGKCKILSLEQIMQKQLLWLMYLLSKDANLIKTLTRETRSTSKITFKVPTRITPKYEKSPVYIGTKLWNELSREIQHCNNVYEFKKEIYKKYPVYKDLLNCNV